MIHQSNSSIMNFTNRVTSGMHVWKNYLENVNDENEVKKFIQNTQEEYGFTDFYFVDYKGFHYDAIAVSYSNEDVQAAKTVGMNEHIAKPLELKILIKTMKKWLG